MATLKLVLAILSGVCWTIVYIEGIRIGFKDKSYAIPFYALALNLAWELLHTYFGFRAGVDVQTIINAVWFAFDLGILYTYFKFGRRDFPAMLPPSWFNSWSVLILIVSFIIEYAFVLQFGVSAGGGYAAFLQNLLMSVLFVNMLVSRGNKEGQRLKIAVSKWIGTLAPTIAFGIIGGPRILILVTGILCSVFDLIYIWLLASWSKRIAIAKTA